MADTTITDGKTGDHAEQKQSSEAVDFPVYMVYSRWSLHKLDTFLQNYGSVGFLRVVFGPNDEETDRTIAILTPDVYEKLCEDGYGDEQHVSKDKRSYGHGCRVIPFKLNDSSYPGEGRNKTLFVPVPKDISSDDTWANSVVHDKLIHLSEWGIIPANSWSINVPLNSREKGGVRGGCFVSFMRNVSLERIAMTRILLTDTYWPPHGSDEDDRAVFRCYWARDRERKPVAAASKPVAGKPSSPEDVKKAKEEKKKRAIQHLVKKAQPVAKKAPTVPSAVQPVLSEEDHA